MKAVTWAEITGEEAANRDTNKANYHRSGRVILSRGLHRWRVKAEWGEWRGAMWRHLRKAGRGEVTWLGDKAQTQGHMMEQYGEGSGRRHDRVATGRRESGRLPAGNFAPLYTIS
jgi:hypothetical protein